MNTMTDVAGKVWSWAFCQSIHARQRAEELLREESAQGTTEYAILVGVLVVIAIYGALSARASTACRGRPSRRRVAGARLCGRGGGSGGLGA